MAGREYPRGLYQTRPVLPLDPHRILDGTAIDQTLASIAAEGVLLVDGFLGIEWEQVKHRIRSLATLADREVFDISEAVLPEQEANACLAPYLDNGDPVFGKLYGGNLEGFFRPDALRLLRARVAQGNAVVVGPGAALVADDEPVVYFDVSKENLQRRPQAPANLYQARPAAQGFYKRAYFVDWPVLERHRHAIRQRIALWVDANNSSRWLALRGDDLRDAISQAAHRPFRVKPWFLPGPWGGQFMKGHMGLNGSRPNFAWSYELIAPENGVLVGSDSAALELPFPFMVAQEPEAYLGESVARRFGYNFPIRFDYLDTIAGGNLSLQCHPSDDFIRGQFGEPFTQDETYYIHDCEEGSTVYLGFRDGADLPDFWRAARASQAEHKPLEVERSINVWPAKKHDMFLIPNGTVHCSGRGNLVLEISATPYIYTFKIHDYVRQDLLGNLRPLHIDFAERNARPERTTGWVKEHLLPPARLKLQGGDWKLYAVCDTPLLFYGVDRLEFSSHLHQAMPCGVELVNLVEGGEIAIVANAGSLDLHYAETAVIPAATGSYELVNRSSGRAKLVKAFVKPT
jgi:mannose-6-phosphate isomerase class I